MAINQSIGNFNGAAVFLMLFGLPFLAVGVEMTWRCARMALASYRDAILD